MFRLKSPLRAQLELTEACNNACIHCYNFWRYLETGTKLNVDNHKRTFEHFKKILDIIINQDISVITFTGGEPFLRKDILYRLIQHAKDAGLKAFINTNTTLLTTKDIFKLKNLEVDSLLVSLLSYNPKIHNSMTHTNSHYKTTKAIQMLADNELPFSVNMVTSKSNWKDVRKTAEVLHQMGVKSFTATPILSCHLSKKHGTIMLTPTQIKQTMEDLVWAKEVLGLNTGILEPLVYCMFTKKEREKFFSILETQYCCAGISDCAISPDGDMRPCILSTEIGGNILQDGWDKCWNNLSRWKNPEMLPPKCLECVLVDFCGGGCRNAALAKHGLLTSQDPYMTEPLLDHDNSLIHSKIRKTLEFSDSDILIPHPDLKMRREDFGGTVYVDAQYLFLTKNSFEFMILLLDEEGISVDRAVKKFNVEELDIRNFFTTLIQSGIFLMTQKGGIR